MGKWDILEIILGSVDSVSELKVLKEMGKRIHILYSPSDFSEYPVPDLKVEITLWSMGYRMDVVLAGMKIAFISLYISIRAPGWTGT